MKIILSHIALFFLLHFYAGAQLLPNLGGQRAGISALTFLKIDPSARSAGMAGAHLTLSADAFSAYTNPASLSGIEAFTAGISNTFWAAGISHSFASANFANERYGNFSLNISSLNTGRMKKRTTFMPDGTGEYFYASNNAIAISYGRKLTNMFSLGGSIRYVNETLAEFTAHTAVVDLGFLYETDFKDLAFAVVLQNFGTNSRLRGEISPIELTGKMPDLESYPAPTVFKIGVSMIPYKKENQHLMLAMQLKHPNDNAENIRIGGEFDYEGFLKFRAGYKINVKAQNLPSFGFGVRSRVGKHPLIIDYSADPTRTLGWFHRIGISFSLNKMERE